jgi:23S rRNA pseudouridine1911/1915/1917 synthase
MDEAVVVVNKPPGLVVHPARGHESGTLVNGLLALGAFDARGADAIADDRDPGGYLRPGIVHRIDKGTSGVLVVARTAAAREKLKAQFQAHTIAREYEAICVGEVRAQTFSTMHGRHLTDRMRFTSRVKNGKRAVTHVRVIASLAGGRATHVACSLETGRTHQIRMHLGESGAPILADPVYGKPPKDAGVRAVADALGHQALHARLLGFVHPTRGVPMRFEAPPPDDFAAALRALAALGS